MIGCNIYIIYKLYILIRYKYNCICIGERMQGCIELTNKDKKDIKKLQKICILNKCSFELSIHQRITYPQKH